MSKLIITFLAAFVACGFFMLGGFFGWSDSWRELENPKQSLLIGAAVLGFIVSAFLFTVLGYWASSKILGGQP